MANTRDTLGDQATLDGLVGDTLTSFEENGVTKIAGNALRNRTALTSVKFPNVTSMGINAFQNCTGLETVDFYGGGSANTIGAYAFSGDTNLKHLVIRSNTMSQLMGNALKDTKIEKWQGVVYVPSSMISTYKANASWKNYIIVSVDDYPMNDEQIDAAFYDMYGGTEDAIAWKMIIENDNYATEYELGKLVPLTINGASYNMELVAKDTDVRADGNGTARMTWIAKDCIGTHNMNSTNTNSNGWPNTAMRSWLSNTILPTISPVVQRAIVPVTKTYYNYTTRSTLSTTDTIWIPSSREIFGETSYENSGVIYSNIFKDDASRIKNNNAGGWWLRSANSASLSGFRYVNSSGAMSLGNASAAYGVVPGFCL